tara:strand:- start:139 stop:531 length:393 start_codon:yes stop_codon:yes gene_type:complete
MAHFAKIDNLEIVVFITVGREEDNGKELELCARTGDTYRQTSYNTRGGIHYKPNSHEPSEDQSKAFRKNFAGIGYTFDKDRDAFIPKKPYTSWVLNESTCQWEAPVAKPDSESGEKYNWNEETKSWDEIV